MVRHGWVALLRAVNLGARNKVPMAGLRELLTDCGCTDVRTYIQSGNALFEHASRDRSALAAELEAAVEQAFGVSTPVVLRTFAEMRRVARRDPFGDGGANTHVAFLAARPAAAKARELEGLDLSPDRVDVTAGEVFLHYANGVQGARLSAAQLERRLGVAATVRNWRTVTKLAELTQDA